MTASERWPCTTCPDELNGCNECGEDPTPCLCELRMFSGAQELGMLSIGEIQGLFERYGVESVRMKRLGLRKWTVLLNDVNTIGACWNSASTLEEALVLAVHRAAEKAKK